MGKAETLKAEKLKQEVSTETREQVIGLLSFFAADLQSGALWSCGVSARLRRAIRRPLDAVAVRNHPGHRSAMTAT